MLFDIIALQTCKYCVKLANACLNIEDMPSGRGYQETCSQEFGLASIGLVYLPSLLILVFAAGIQTGTQRETVSAESTSSSS